MAAKLVTEPIFEAVMASDRNEARRQPKYPVSPHDLQ